MEFHQFTQNIFSDLNSPKGITGHSLGSFLKGFHNMTSLNFRLLKESYSSGLIFALANRLHTENINVLWDKYISLSVPNEGANYVRSH